MKKNWNRPEIVELDIKSTEKHNGNHYGWNNPHNPHYGCQGNDDADVIS